MKTYKDDGMKISWISQHDPTPSQRAELTRLFGPHALIMDVSPFADAADIARRIRKTCADEVVCIAPLSVLQKLTSFGIRPLNATMDRCEPEEAEVVAGNPPRHYKFKKFRRLMGIEMSYEEISPTAAGLRKENENGTNRRF